ncbi:hypothetical protein [Hyphobacterium marinum]|uniref:Uncharacterized protein n=1 Tax=Hyphobacterium marinum TaxID=3116574 RepID=A0ABU7LY52_9PROT|nr:hypothetical protein [Hyphobacterium sp. Y6023]MEE2565935.1 hypothetical protein [Hyphobacterium sp. Y6023]
MRNLLVALTAVSMTAPAFAGPGSELAETAGRLRSEAESRAETYTAMPGASIPPIGQDDPFLTDVSEFATASAMLSHRIEASGGPQDLRCIFRGMSGDAQDRIADLETSHSGAELARIYRDYVYLFAQAEEIAPLADDPDVEEADGVPPSCPVESLD